MKLQTPKGTRDFLPKDMLLRRKVTDILASIYRIFGFQEWDGPAFEYLETLSRKGGELVANEIYSLCSKIGINYEDIIKVMVLDSRIGSDDKDSSGKDVHLRVAQDGLKGFGGKCLPKDILELTNFMKQEKCGYGLLEKVIEINNKLRNNN